MDDKSVPQWLLKEDSYEPPKDRDIFLHKSAQALTFAASQIRRVDERNRSRISFSTQIKLALTITTILLVSAARNFAFVELVGCALFVRLAFLEPKKLTRVLAMPFQASILAALILAPSLLLGQSRAVIVVPCKTFITTAVLAMMAYSTNWNRFTCAFKSFGIPDSALFIFDLTLKYVVVLSETCLATIEAARLRSVGRNRRKERTFGGIVGTTFLRAQKSAQEQFDGMTCRCFSGNYRRFRAPFHAVDWIGLACCLVMFAIFLYLEYSVRCLS